MLYFQILMFHQSLLPERKKPTLFPFKGNIYQKDYTLFLNILSLFRCKKRKKTSTGKQFLYSPLSLKMVSIEKWSFQGFAVVRLN